MVDGCVDFKSTGKLSAFVCNKMSDLRIPPREAGDTTLELMTIIQINLRWSLYLFVLCQVKDKNLFY